MTDIVELYMDGLTIDDIAYEVFGDKTKIDWVIDYLLSLKTKDKNGKDYTYKFKEMVVERALSGVKKGKIKEELGVAYRTINKYLNEFNVAIPKKGIEQEDNMYQKIEWSRFDCCPTCNSKNVNDIGVGTHKEEDESGKNSYCLDCGTEWIGRGGETYKILWEFVR